MGGRVGRNFPNEWITITECVSKDKIHELRNNKRTSSSVSLCFLVVEGTRTRWVRRRKEGTQIGLVWFAHSECEFSRSVITDTRFVCSFYQYSLEGGGSRGSVMGNRWSLVSLHFIPICRFTFFTLSLCCGIFPVTALLYGCFRINSRRRYPGDLLVIQW